MPPVRRGYITQRDAEKLLLDVAEIKNDLKTLLAFIIPKPSGVPVRFIETMEEAQPWLADKKVWCYHKNKKNEWILESVVTTDEEAPETLNLDALTPDITLVLEGDVLEKMVQTIAKHTANLVIIGQCIKEDEGKQ